METFELHPQLEADTLMLGEFDLSVVLLMNNALVPWFVLVPRTDVKEIFQLGEADQHTLLNEINVVAKFLNAELGVDKINIGQIGNVVPQLHVHVVGRFKNDLPGRKPFGAGRRRKSTIRCNMRNWCGGLTITCMSW